MSSHHEKNYSGAVARLNLARAELESLDWGKAGRSTINGLKREELVTANSAFLHELYFETFGEARALKAGGLSVAFARDYGSIARWEAEFKAVAKALSGGSGWVILAWSTQDNCLIIQSGADHSDFLAGAQPILALDMYEHSYHIDFGADAAGYVDAYMRNIDWEKANARYAAVLAQVTRAMGLERDELAAAPGNYQLLDVRRAGAYEAAKTTLPGAVWMDPEKIDDWAASLSPSKPVVVYCVFGHEVGQSTAAILRSRGVDARFLTGGIHDWTNEKRPVEQK